MVKKNYACMYTLEINLTYPSIPVYVPVWELFKKVIGIGRKQVPTRIALNLKLCFVYTL